jgi:protein-tyrosine phosphatase
LPGVDDGSPSLEVSVAVLRRFRDEGVTQVVCTPHLEASRAHEAPVSEHRALLAALQGAVPEVTLLGGWEIMLDQPGVPLANPDLALGTSRSLLVEFSRAGIPRGALAELRRLVTSGRAPILAHPERYFGCTTALVRAFRAIGTVIQTDVSVLVGRGRPSELARDLLAAGLIDILASDNHGDRRSLAAGRDWLRAQGASADAITLLTERNAALVLRNEDPLPVPPVSTGGAVARVRRLFGR